jgi:hypothetical protein
MLSITQIYKGKCVTDETCEIISCKRIKRKNKKGSFFIKFWIPTLKCF